MDGRSIAKGYTMTEIGFLAKVLFALIPIGGIGLFGYVVFRVEIDAAH